MDTIDESRRVVYNGGAVFIPRCDKCGRYVKADDMLKVSDFGVSKEDNATCKKCGRTNMIFEGFLD